MSTLNLSGACGSNFYGTSRNAGIFILTQNKPQRVASLKTSLYFLFKNFNAIPAGYRYPVFIMHEGDFDVRTQEEIFSGIRRNCRESINFVQIDESDFTVPNHIDIPRMINCINQRPVPYWRDARYRMMCRWWLVHFPKYTGSFDYVMRLDDDSFIEEPIPDLIDYAKSMSLNYIYNTVHLDCGVCCLGLRHSLDSVFPGRSDELSSMFLYQNIEPFDVLREQLRRITSISGIKWNDDLINGSFSLSMPIMFYNNFFITKTSFWRNPDVMNVIEKIDQVGGIFYHRWGDAPIQSIVLKMLSPANKLHRADFKYSKRIQREAFIDDLGGVHSFVGEKYS